MNKLVVHESEETSSGLPVGYEGPGVGSLAVSLARAEIDQQILTARAMPRSISRSVGNIMTLATLDEASAEECIYALPRAGKAIKGPSIRLAEIIASQYGNCRVGARVVHVDRYEKFVEAEGVFHDLETNTATTSRVRRRISNKRGDLLQEDMIIVTGNAACAIAKRNAILGGVPKAVWRKAYDAVESVIAGDIKTLAERRPMALKAFAAFGVKPEQIFEALGVAGLDDITLDHMGTLTGMRSSLKSGESTVEEMFPVKPVPSSRPDLKASLDKLADVAADDTPPSPHQGEAHDSPAPSAATEPAGGVPPGPAEAAQGPLEGVAASPPGAAAPSERDLALSAFSEGERKLRKAEIHQEGQARAEAGKVPLMNYIEQLRANGEDGLVTSVTKAAWHDTAKAADAERGRAAGGRA
jgi:hypothetical protein